MKSTRSRHRFYYRAVVHGRSQKGDWTTAEYVFINKTERPGRARKIVKAEAEREFDLTHKETAAKVWTDGPYGRRELQHELGYEQAYLGELRKLDEGVSVKRGRRGQFKKPRR